MPWGQYIESIQKCLRRCFKQVSWGRNELPEGREVIFVEYLLYARNFIYVSFMPHNKQVLLIPFVNWENEESRRWHAQCQSDRAWVMWTLKSKLFLTQSLWCFRQGLHGHLVGFWKRGLGKRLWERTQRLIPSNPKILWLAENKTYILSAPSLPNNNQNGFLFHLL